MDIDIEKQKQAWADCRAFIAERLVDKAEPEPEDIKEVMAVYQAACMQTVKNVCGPVWAGAKQLARQGGKTTLIKGWREAACKEKCPFYEDCQTTGQTGAHANAKELIKGLKAIALETDMSQADVAAIRQSAAASCDGMKKSHDKTEKIINRQSNERKEIKI